MDVCIILGSKSDMPVCDKCTSILSILNINHSVHIASAHRTPKHLEAVVENSIDNGCKIFIGMAGLAAALPGVIASMTSLPVIGVPVGGAVPFDSLLSIVQMPPGMPVATVGVGRGDNAAILAGQILALSNDEVSTQVIKYRNDRANQVLLDDAALRE
ncbi:MAG: 5-(carboxyamino)imidazole ribonucleotide mutase [Candidatus Poseidoniales archaeon]|jgi:5-(carboxyamino)imidazole ribonucleotide mutase|tara:strand:- start:258 stop:731 length:474 start_codon:yes stop_codon:yes gene_type:complete